MHHRTLVPRPRITERQRAANRSNARRSTGPRTEAGLSTSSLNALKHGLRSQLTVIPGENAAEFQSLFDAFAEQRDKHFG